MVRGRKYNRARAPYFRNTVYIFSAPLVFVFVHSDGALVLYYYVRIYIRLRVLTLVWVLYPRSQWCHEYVWLYSGLRSARTGSLRLKGAMYFHEL